MDDIPQFVAPLKEPPNRNWWLAILNPAHVEQSEHEKRRIRARQSEAKCRANNTQQKANKLLQDKILELLRIHEHMGVQLAERLGITTAKAKAILSRMSRAKLIVRDNERKPWRVA